MSSATPELLARSVGRTLEEAAFVFADAADVAPLPFSGTVVEARLPFWGQETGELRIATDEQLAAELAANLLGEDVEDPAIATRGREALAELANMIVGALVIDLFGDGVPCRLGVPAIRILAAAQYGREVPTAPCSVTLITEEGRRLDAALQTKAAGG